MDEELIMLFIESINDKLFKKVFRVKSTVVEYLEVFFRGHSKNNIPTIFDIIIGRF